MTFTRIKAIVTCFALTIAAFVYAADKPKITTYNYTGQCMMAMSDNGQWGLVFVADDNEAPAKLVDLKTKKVVNLQTEEEIKAQGRGVVADVSDDGNIIVGAIKGYPAYYNRTTKTWTKLPSDGKSGCCHAVTPDGKYAVGKVDDREEYEDPAAWYSVERGKMWDLTTGEEVKLPASLIPTKDPKGDVIAYMRFLSVSPDGRYIAARTLTYAEYFTLLIDREENTCKFVGFETKDGGKSYTPQIKDLYFNEPGAMSPDGKWLVTNGYFVEQQPSGFANEYSSPVRYNIETGAIEAFNQKTDDHGVYSICIDNEGNVFGATPTGDPIREFYIRNGNYWYSLRSVLSRRYGMDYLNETALDNTGTPVGVSSDGNTFISMVDPQFGQNFCLQMNESLVEICKDLNLLGVYSISPYKGSVMSKLNQFKITFDREVEVVGEQTAATFGTWKSLSNNGIYVDPTDPRSIIIVFRSRTLTEGEEYTLTIPAGVICIKGDETKVNEDITAKYVGRANAPVVPSTVYPADGSVLAKLDNSSSPVILQFPYIINVSETASAALYREEGTKMCNLQVSSNGNTVYITPATTQYLFADNNYKVVLAAGSIADVSGNGGNEELTIHYSGSYEREISTDETVLFKDDFSIPASSVGTWLLYDNDRNTPADAMKEMEFDEENTPWNFSVRESSETSDFCAASHSMYKPAGQSDDWMVTPQIYIPDNLCSLTFDAQSYKKNKSDRLKVAVWKTDDVLNFISPEDFQRLSTECEVIVDELLSPGKDEEGLSGDWKAFKVDLSKYEGCNIYIAFINQNRDQSMVFVDNVLVNRNMNFLLSLKNKQSVINETGVTISGTITGNNEKTAYSNLVLTLFDAEGQQVDRISESGLALSKGKSYSFSFANQLPLTVGQRNNFSIGIQLDDLSESVNSYVNALAFQPTKRVVLEEITGTTCGNCPQGIIAIDRMKELYGEQFIPISIHTYDGDAWGAGLSAYSLELGLRAAPSGIVNRSTEILYPMMQDPETFDLTLSYYGYLWMDAVAAEFDNETDIDVSAEVSYDEAAGSISVPVSVKSAMNVKNQNYNVFLVLMEDKLTGNQLNYYSSQTDPVLGEWGQGGRYGKGNVTVVHNDVVRMCYGASVYGTSGLLPQNMVAGETYTTSAFGNLALPGTLENAMNAKVAVIIIDANTDKIVNACVAYLDKMAGIKTVNNNPLLGNDSRYNLAGQKVAAGFKGIVIRNGKKVLVR